MKARVWTQLTCAKLVQFLTQTVWWMSVPLQEGNWVLYLFVWIDIDVAFDTFLSHVGPGIATHPLPLALGALVFSKASFFPLVGCESFAFGSGLWRKSQENKYAHMEMIFFGFISWPDAVFLSVRRDIFKTLSCATVYSGMTIGSVHYDQLHHIEQFYTQFWINKRFWSWHVLPSQLWFITVLILVRQMITNSQSVIKKALTLRLLTILSKETASMIS